MSVVEAGRRAFDAEFRAALFALLGRDNPDLLDFGVNPVKPRSTSVHTKALALAKSEVTRQKRNTQGSVQKAPLEAVGVPTLTLGP